MSLAVRALLEQVVDYAGVYPPASLDVQTAASNYAAYRASDDRWMLGRFVVGVAKIPELRAVVRSLRPAQSAWPITVVAPDAAAATAVIRGTDDGAIRIDSIEVKAHSAAEILLISRAAAKKREVYVEVALNDALPAMLDAIAAAKLRAKVRMGGVTAEAFPSSAAVVGFIRGCIDRSLAFKATAGLHHPLRGVYRLTYERDARLGEMFGFLNMFLAPVLMKGGLSDGDAALLLEETDVAAFTIGEQTIAWRDHVADIEAIRAGRSRLATSFGSCSFREPVDELPFASAAAPAE